MRSIITALVLTFGLLASACGVSSAQSAQAAQAAHVPFPGHPSVSHMSSPIFTPDALAASMTAAPRFWDGRVVDVAVRAGDVAWGWGSDSVDSTYQLAIGLMPDAQHIQYAFNIAVRPDQMESARSYAHAHHSAVGDDMMIVLCVRLLRRDTQIKGTPVVADAVYLGTAPHLAALAARYIAN